MCFLFLVLIMVKRRLFVAFISAARNVVQAILGHF